MSRMLKDKKVRLLLIMVFLLLAFVIFMKPCYAAGDVSTVPYKQIIISMGEGAKAALSAFDDRVRGVI